MLKTAPVRFSIGSGLVGDDIHPVLPYDSTNGKLGVARLFILVAPISLSHCGIFG